MKFNKFKEIIDLNVKISQKINQSYKLGIDLANFFDEYERIASLLWKEILTDEGEGWLSWFLYDKGYINDGIGKETLKAFDKDNIEICRDLKELYELLSKEGHFKCE